MSTVDNLRIKGFLSLRVITDMCLLCWKEPIDHLCLLGDVLCSLVLFLVSLWFVSVIAGSLNGENRLWRMCQYHGCGVILWILEAYSVCNSLIGLEGKKQAVFNKFNAIL